MTMTISTKGKLPFAGAMANRIQMKNLFRTKASWLAILFVGLAALSLPVNDVLAQDEIVVTARKRAENLQDVPISITAISQDELRNANAFGLEDLAQLTPGLSFRSLGGFNEVTIRGLAQTDQISLVSNVGVFIDGIFLNNRSSIEFNNMDLAQIEVLKGPQSALFGRNTFAGAINYRTREATLGEYDATLEAEAGSHDRFGFKGSVNVPISDFGAIRVFGGWSQFDGAIENVRGGDNVGGWNERHTIGVSALVEVDRFRLKGFFVRNDIDEDQPPLRTIGFRSNNAGSEYVSSIMGDPNVFTLFAGDVPTFENVDLFPTGMGNVGHFWLAYGNLDIDADFATITINYSHSESEYAALFDNLGDPDAINRPFFGGPVSAQFLTNSTGDVAEQDALDVRIASNENSPFDWLVGYSYYDNVTGGNLSTITPLVGMPDVLEILTDTAERIDQQTHSVYGTFSVPVTDRLNVGGEIRYTDESQVLIDIFEFPFFPFLSRPPTMTPADFNYFSGRASVDFAVTDDILLYGYAARGVKSGGANAPGSPFGFETFDPETNWTYELGVKSTLLGGRAVVNAAVYYIDWTELQTTVPPSLVAAPAIINGTGASSKGFELEASVDVTDNFNVRLATTYIDAQYDDGFIDGAVEPFCGVNTATNVLISACSADVGGNQIARTSDFQLFASGKYTFPQLIGDIDGYVRADFSHEASIFPQSLNILKQGARNLFNIRLGLTKEDAEVAFWMDNVLDENIIDRTTIVSDLEATASCANCGVTLARVYPGNGRTWGFKVLKRF